jgi:hypothetical protein
MDKETNTPVVLLSAAEITGYPLEVHPLSRERESIGLVSLV